MSTHQSQVRPAREMQLSLGGLPVGRGGGGGGRELFLQRLALGRRPWPLFLWVLHVSRCPGICLIFSDSMVGLLPRIW